MAEMSDHRATATDDIVIGLPAIAEAAGASSPNTAFRWIRDEGLPAFRLGRGWASHRAAIGQWFRERAEAGRG
jgi:predicted DNA-binding transcriptional regulator AlpA